MGENVDTYEQTLEQRTPSAAILVGKLGKSSLYHSIETKSIQLSKDDILCLLDLEKIPWSWLRKEVLASIEENRAKKKGQVASATKRHTKRCGQLQVTMAKSTVAGVELGTDKKKVEWESSLYSLAIEFTTELCDDSGIQEIRPAATVGVSCGFQAHCFSNEMFETTDLLVCVFTSAILDKRNIDSKAGTCSKSNGSRSFCSHHCVIILFYILLFNICHGWL